MCPARSLAGYGPCTFVHSLADVFVFEAFGAAHRPHSSINGLKGRVPLRVAGLLMKKELSYFSQVCAMTYRGYLISKQACYAVLLVRSHLGSASFPLV